MCGICGLLARDTADPALVESMNAAIVHRGPDHGAIANYGRCVLGYRRLSIIDLQTGDQPVESESGAVAAVFNGELYNFRELRRELEAKGHQIRGTGDSPLIPHAYEEWGLDFPTHLDGMFAIALWDRAAERLVLVRDRLGKKPLLYARLPDGSLAFASETKALLRLPALPRELDLQQLDAFLALQYVPRSGLKAVEKVPPGSLVVAEGGTVRSERYWRPRPAAGTASDGEWVERVRSEVTAAVRRRLVSDVPLGALLSGGLDSSIVVSAMAAASPEPVRTFTIGFPDRRYDERAHAREVAARFGARHEELEVDPGPGLLDRLAGVFDEPFGDEAALPLLLVCEATRRHVTVALVGDGGDEAFGGYQRYRAHALAGRVPRRLAALGTGALGVLPAARRQPRSTLFRARRFLDAAAQPPAARYARLVEVFPLELRRALWTDEARAQAASTLLPHDPDLRLVDIESYLPGDLLPKSDLASMAVSLELRSPLLDHHVVELGLALPPSLAAGKRALQKAFAADLPRRDALAREDRLRRPARPLVPRRAPLDRGGAPARRARPRPLPPARDRAAPARARRGACRPRPPAVVPLHARAVAAPLRRCGRANARRGLAGGLQVAQHRQHAAVVALGRRQPELREDRADVLLDRALGDDDPRGDRRVRAPLGHQGEHLALARAQVVERVAAAGPRDELADDLGVDRGAAGRDPVDRLEELARLGDAVLEQIADPACVPGEELAGVPLLDVLREHEHRELRCSLPQLERRTDALVGERRRHANVDDRHLGLLAHDRGEEPGRVAGGRQRPRGRAPRAGGRARRGAAPSPRRSRCARKLHETARAAAGRRDDGEGAVDRRGAVGEAGETGSEQRVRAAAAVVGDLDPQPAVDGVDADRRRPRLGVRATFVSASATMK